MTLAIEPWAFLLLAGTELRLPHDVIEMKRILPSKNKNAYFICEPPASSSSKGSALVLLGQTAVIGTQLSNARPIMAQELRNEAKARGEGGRGMCH